MGAVQRLAGQGGDPVQLQTNFGGGKTHSMLALYHLFSGTAPNELPGIDGVMQDAGVKTLPTARRVVLVGNKISPAIRSPNPMARWCARCGASWRGSSVAKKAFQRADDEKATSPGDVLRELNTYGLILIDEWVAYARQLHDQSDLPAGTFETQFTFAQALTEAAKAASTACWSSACRPRIPQTPRTQTDDVEVGGQRGREALDRLRNVVGRVESSWRPASAEEGLRSRRRLFEPLTDPAHFRDRDVVARAFADLYRTQHQEFPPECRDADYEKRLRAAYPIHPEVFDRLYTDWSTLVKFQRTRGVLRLMAAVIHSLWEKGDRNPLIQPANIPIDDPHVSSWLALPLGQLGTDPRKGRGRPRTALTARWRCSEPRQVRGQPACGATIYLGSAPDDRRQPWPGGPAVKLGCVMPGESPAVFGDALRRLAAAATYLYQDGPRYWYSTPRSPSSPRTAPSN